jgi:hypothetical protein
MLEYMIVFWTLSLCANIQCPSFLGVVWKKGTAHFISADMAVLVTGQAVTWMVGWGTMLHVGRLWVRFPLKSSYFSVDLMLPATLWLWSQFSDIFGTMYKIGKIFTLCTEYELNIWIGTHVERVKRSATEYSSTRHPSPFPPFAECIITDCK